MVLAGDLVSAGTTLVPPALWSFNIGLHTPLGQVPIRTSQHVLDKGAQPQIAPRDK